MPAISCSTPANVALLAGFVPRFADVDASTGMATLESIQARWTPQTCAVLFIHLFGSTADLRSIAEWCRSKNILLIEDLAQALGARLPNEDPAGSVGDLSVYSFNPTKILECGGGALLIRTRSLVPIWKKVCAENPLPPEIGDEDSRALELSYRNLHHSLVALFRTGRSNETSVSFLKLEPAYRELYLRPMKSAAALARDWEGLPAILELRSNYAQQYASELEDGPWQTLDAWRQSGVCWRYSLLVNRPEKLVAFSEAVRRDGFHVSNLYWPLNDFFRPADRCPNAKQFARRIVNLWVDSTVGPEWVRHCCASLHRHSALLAS
jgi:dTDP-4-amino-4,6-dideoxygalactose transaminase